MSLREQLKLNATLAQSFAQTQWAAPRLMETAQHCHYADVPPVSPSATELQGLYKRFGHAFATGTWNDVAWHDWRRAPWVLWYGKKIHTLAIQREFLPRLQQHIQHDEAAIKRLIYVYLRDFSEGRPNLSQVAEFIRHSIDAAHPSSLLYRWKHIQKRYQLFNLNDIAGKLAQACLMQEALEVLEDAGLRGELRDAGFAQAAYQEALKMLDKGLRQQPQEVLPLLENFFHWSLNEGQLRYPACRRELLHTLLLPWLQSAASSVLRTQILSFLLQHIGHPGCVPQAWQDVRTPALRILHFWLSGHLLDSFFQLCESQPHISNWRIRQEFWQHYQKRGLIDESWLVVGEQASQCLAYPEALHGAQTQQADIDGNPNEAVLLLRLQNIVIADWAHAGQTLIWQSKNPYVPAFYQAHYPPKALDVQAEKITDDHQWQAKVSQFIYQHAQLPLLLTDADQHSQSQRTQRV